MLRLLLHSTVLQASTCWRHNHANSGLTHEPGALRLDHLEEDWALLEGPCRALQAIIHFGCIIAAQGPAFLLDPPAQLLICCLLMSTHGVHDLQPGALMSPVQEGPAVRMDLADAIKRCKEFVADLGGEQQANSDAEPSTATSMADCMTVRIVPPEGNP